jgi:DNA-binding LacI/PurR family transcriptional regulator
MMSGSLQMNDTVTMDTIAKKAGVSKSTVSYVLSGKKKMSEEVREKVLSTAGELGYRPQPVAERLFSDAPQFVRIVFDTFDVSYDTAVFRHELLRGILEQFSGTNYQLCLASRQAAVDRDAVVGVISVFPKKQSEPADDPVKLPVVYVGSQQEVENTFSVDVDGVGAGYQAALQVLDQAGRRVLFVKDHDWPEWYDQYENGFQMAFFEREAAWYPERSVVVESPVELLEMLHQTEPYDAVIVPSGYYAALLRYHPLCTGSLLVSMKQFIGPISPKGFADSCTATLFPAYSVGKEAAAMLMDVITKQRVMHNAVILTCDFSWKAP